MAHNRELNALTQRVGCFVQAENANATYTVNWAALLDTDTISSSAWSSEDAGVTISNESATTTEATARLTGDVGRYRIVNQVTTASGDTYERWLDLTVKDNTSGYTHSTDDYGQGYL